MESPSIFTNPPETDPEEILPRVAETIMAVTRGDRSRLIQEGDNEVERPDEFFLPHPSEKKIED